MSCLSVVSPNRRLTGSEQARKDDQSQIVDEVVLYQRPRELIAGLDGDFSVRLKLELRRESGGEFRAGLTSFVVMRVKARACGRMRQ
jgi:hypothetical protein